MERLRKTGILTGLSRAGAFMTSTSCVVIVALLVTLLRPAIVAAQIDALTPDPPERPSKVVKVENHETELAETLAAAAEDLSRLEAGAAGKGPDLPALRGRIDTFDRKVAAGFDQLDAHLVKHRLPEVIRARQREARQEYRQKMEALLAGLSEIEKASDPAAKAKAAGAVLEQLREVQVGRPHQPLDPENLPVSRPQAPPRKAAETLQEFGAFLGKSLTPATAEAVVVPQPADLLANEDVQLTPEIRGLAFELGGKPLAIYNWVYDNIELVPTYGSIQGSQMTLESKRGNAFDIASLLVALLRASNIPARYVLGTIQAPAARVSNWLGGTASARVSQQLLGQGGIPNVGLLQGDQITHLRIEHVWVEAWVDFVPGRGVKAGPGNTWVPMDASFKQHEFTPGEGALAAVPFDMAAFSNALLQGAEVDPLLGRIAGIDPLLAFSAMEDLEARQQEFLASRGVAPGREALLGKTSIVPSTAKVLPASLPYELVVRASSGATLPDRLRLGVTLNGFASPFDRALGNPSFSYRISLPALNSHRLGITYTPATAADAQTLQSARDANASSLPLHLVNVRPVITLDGAEVATGPAVRMGSTQFVDVVLRDVDGSSTVPYQVIAGDEAVFGLNGNGVAPGVVEARFERVAPNTVPETLHQVALHYWMECDFVDQLAATGLQVHSVRRFSVGLFSSPLQVGYLFGTPRSGVYQSRFMDVKRSLVGVAGETPEKTRAFVRASGQMGSFLEGSVFDQLSGSRPGKGVSAMQLIFDATLGNVPVYTITADNVALVLPRLQVSSAVRSDISNAINAGQTVMIPESELLHDNYRGIGYIVEDPGTGAAAYLISGGLNGGMLPECSPDLVPVLVVILAIILLLILLWWLLPWLAGALAGAGAAGAPALASLIALIAALFMTAAPAHAAPWETGGRADPCNCPPCNPPPPCQIHLVPPSDPHGDCPGDHWHYFAVHQGPAPECRCRTQRYFGDCIPPPPPSPPC